LEGFMRANPKLGYRYLFKPDSDLIFEFNFVDFKPKRSQRLIKIGQDLANRVITEGEAVEFSRFKASFN
jgi:predicted RNA-binding protein Jag